MKHLRRTPQRDIILDYLKNSREHPTAELVYEKVKEKLPSISLATVYRNLNMLAAKGEITRIDIGHEAHFDGDTSSHLHFICKKCKKIYDKHGTTVFRSAKRCWQERGFAAEQTNVLTFGLCNKCKR